MAVCDVCAKSFLPITEATQTTCVECLTDNVYTPLKVAIDQVDIDGAFVSQELTRLQILRLILPTLLEEI